MCYNCVITNLIQISIPVATLIIVAYILKRLKNIEEDIKIDRRYRELTK